MYDYAIYLQQTSVQLVQDAEEIFCIGETDPDILIIVEKDTVFARICQSSFIDDANAILLTGRGYPPLKSRQVACTLSQRFPEMAVVCLTDADPDGIAIAATYKFGSPGLCAEPDCTVSHLQHIGLSISDVASLSGCEQCLVPMSAHDVSVLGRLLATPAVMNDRQLRLQVMQLQSSGSKAEIESLGTVDTNYLVEKYLPSKLFEDVMMM
jgi:meiotic recombination protein SPO11